ncbi:hypothetical protein [Dictyobacter arantiisoli]|uniref:Uncharacterized protein n=1 Tax=Dictyobacter arantiisoli TaxID=2014874 RepID=A0A5A5TB54_9CHLR|nr:hypothetical protein [Dictyobacter arantiisoli]GCF08475.1 hypothetical protein KDI_20390 [Dictyobacter arantiisoli]
MQKPPIHYLHRISLLALLLTMALAMTATFSTTTSYAATKSTHPEKTIGAGMIVNGHKYVTYTPASTSAFANIIPTAVQSCVFEFAEENNVYTAGGYTYFNYSMTLTNRCPTGVTALKGNWSVNGSVVCNGVTYPNFTSDSGPTPQLAVNQSQLVADQIPFEAYCIGETLGIPYFYPPSQIILATDARGPLSNGNTWQDGQTDYF